MLLHFIEIRFSHAIVISKRKMKEETVNYFQARVSDAQSMVASKLRRETRTRTTIDIKPRPKPGIYIHTRILNKDEHSRIN